MASYHSYVPPSDHPRIQGLDKADVYEYSRKITSLPLAQEIFQSWRDNLSVPFYGITTDGKKKENLYPLQDEGAPTREMTEAANMVLASWTPGEKETGHLDLDSEGWRKWTNPELVIFDSGLRLEKLKQHKINLIMALLKVSFSEVGFAKIKDSIKTNEFLGEICNARAILNKHSYFFMLFGNPSETSPWGYTFTGHHLCLNVFIIGKQMTVGPCFIGAEPNVIDQGPHAGTELMIREADIGLKLMQSLSPELQTRARVHGQMHDPAMAADRWNLADQQHVAGATQDNRIIPYEGVLATELGPAQQAQLISLIATFHELLPTEPLKHRLHVVRQHLSETYFGWIGGSGDDDPFYYRIQSPVVLMEFDHHIGVFLTNEEPQKYHIHTIHRYPNGNDYGRELIRQWRAKN